MWLLMAMLSLLDGVTVKLGDQFQKKTWANKLEMRRKLHSLRLKEGDSVQDHIRQN